MQEPIIPEQDGIEVPGAATPADAAQQFADMIMTWAAAHRQQCTCAAHEGSPIFLDHWSHQSYALLIQQHPNEFKIIATVLKAAMKQANAAYVLQHMPTATTPEISRLDPNGTLPDLGKIAEISRSVREAEASPAPLPLFAAAHGSEPQERG